MYIQPEDTLRRARTRPLTQDDNQYYDTAERRHTLGGADWVRSDYFAGAANGTGRRLRNFAGE
jgi:hypothetical protein